MSKGVVVAAMTRTAVGKFLGSLSDVSSLELGTFIIKSVLKQVQINTEEIGEVVFGHVENRSEESCLARWAALRAGLPEHVSGYNVQKLCGSGMQAIHNAAEAIMLGRTGIAIAGGVENMTRYPFIMDKARFGYRMGDDAIKDTLMQTLADNLDPQRKPAAQTAENLANMYKITREDQDVFSYTSHQRAIKAITEGKFMEEIVPLQVPVSKKEVKVFDTDEHPRADTTVEKLGKLPPIIPGGTVTAGNACGINDGASAMVLMSEEKAQEYGVKPLARIVSMAAIGCRPDIFGIGPAPALRLAANRAGMTLNDLELMEINEAFAAQVIAVERELGLDHQIVNVNGGAVALGHALGNSGIRISITLLKEMKRRGLKYGASSLCIGSGMGIATIWENLE
ncbi:MAG: thiolase family protein [Bacillota bacterium]